MWLQPSEDFVPPLQVQYQGLIRMITVLGIGGTFQIGFQISTITYMSQVGEAAPGTVLMRALGPHCCLRLLLWHSEGFDHSILLSFPISMLS